MNKNNPSGLKKKTRNSLTLNNSGGVAAEGISSARKSSLTGDRTKDGQLLGHKSN
jgi:hypothetical protein